MSDDYMNEPCQKGGKHDWNLIFHSSGLTIPVVGGMLECGKCKKEHGEVHNLTNEQWKEHKKNMGFED